MEEDSMQPSASPSVVGIESRQGKAKPKEWLILVPPFEELELKSESA